MIKFSLSISDVDKFKTFLASSDLPYVTILVSNETVYFMTDTKELYIHYAFKVLSKHNLDNPELFRLDRKILSSLLVESILEVNLDSSSVNLKFIKSGGKVIYTYETVRQVDVLGNYLERLSLLDEVEDYSKIQLTSVNRIVRFGKSLGADICCTENIASVRLAGGFVFCNVKSEPFVCSAKMLALLVNYTLSVYNVQNYLIHKSSDIVIMVTKHRNMFAPEIDFIKEQPTLFRVDFEMQNAIELCKRLRFQDFKFVLDTEAKVVEIEAEHSSFKSTIEVTSIKSRAPKHKDEITNLDLQNLDLNIDTDLNLTGVDVDVLSDVNSLGIPRIEIPIDILNKILFAVGRNPMSMLIKENFVVIKIKYIYVIFGRRDN